MISQTKTYFYNIADISSKKTPKIAVLSDSDEDEDDFKKPKKKGRKIALSDTDDEDDFSSPKPSTSKGKIIVLKHKICQ